MNAVKHFLGNYSDNFAAALVLWPVLSFMLTLPILAYLYHRDGRLRFGTFVGAYLTVLYICGLGCFTLYPLPHGDAGLGITYGVAPNFNPMNFLNDIAKDGLKAVFQLAFNVVFFMPLGFIAGRLLRLRFLPSVLLGMATSLLIEVSQLTGLFGIYPYAYRCCDVDDVITNTLGAALGWLCTWLLGRVVPPGQLADAEPTDRPGFVRRCVALWIDLVIVWPVSYTHLPGPSRRHAAPVRRPVRRDRPLRRRGGRRRPFHRARPNPSPAGSRGNLPARRQRTAPTRLRPADEPGGVRYSEAGNALKECSTGQECALSECSNFADFGNP